MSQGGGTANRRSGTDRRVGPGERRVHKATGSSGDRRVRNRRGEPGIARRRDDPRPSYPTEGGLATDWPDDIDGDLDGYDGP